MEILSNLLLGASVALSWANVAFCFSGVLLGTIVGMLPGLSPVTVISILLPLAYNIGDPITCIIFLAGIYYGSQYGGSTSAILLRMPGETASIVTTIDGYAMTLKGRAGAALAISALSSFFAGTVATLLIGLLAIPMSQIAFLFGPAEYTALMLLGLLATVALSTGDFLKGVAMALTGILLGMIGTDVNTGIPRYTFDNYNLLDGISFAVLAVGIFGFGELIYNFFHEKNLKITIPKFKELYPSRSEFNQSLLPTLRGTFIGSVLGILPGAGALLSSFGSYALEKKIAKDPENFGKGKIAGIAGPEAANNAGAQTSFIPMLSLGIPTTAVMTLMIASLMIYGIQPGPQVISSNPDLFWGLIVSMWIGNLMLVILNLPLIGIWVSVLRIPKLLLYSFILILCIIGIYSASNNWFEVWLLIPFTLMGYIFKRLGCEPAPLAMGFVIGIMFEDHLRRALQISRGDWFYFLDKPISLGLLIITATIVVTSIYIKSRNIKII
jgi:TctA family transporter